MVRLLLALALVGCSIPDVTFIGGGGGDDVVMLDGGLDGPVGNKEVIVRWTLNHAADSSRRSCPPTTDSTTILVNTWDPGTLFLGTPAQLYPAVCANGQQTIMLPAGTYVIHMLVQDSANINLGVSDLKFVDATTATTVDLSMYDDAGFFAFSWGLVDHPGGSRVTCTTARVTSPTGTLDLISTNTTTTAQSLDKFNCDHHVGSTKPLPPGTYSFMVRGQDNGTPRTGIVTLPSNGNLPVNSLIILPDVTVPVAASAR